MTTLKELATPSDDPLSGNVQKSDSTVLRHCLFRACEQTCPLSSKALGCVEDPTTMNQV